MDVRPILVTGASGFIGQRLVRALEADGHAVQRMSRSALSGPGVVHADLLDRAALQRACENVGVVFHCAGHAHAGDDGRDARLHRDVNFVGTRNLADAAGRAGVGCFVFMSSVKAMGLPGAACVDETWPVPPDTEYGRAKRDAEDAVLESGQRFGMRTTNLRLAMVYGRGGRGNLDRMARAILQGWFPPLPETGAKRSLVHVDDVVAVALKVMDDLRATGRTYIIADWQAYSGHELYAALRFALGFGDSRWECPASWLRAAGALGDVLQKIVSRQLPMNRRAVERLIDAECYSPALIANELGWHARVSLRDGLREAFADLGRGVR